MTDIGTDINIDTTGDKVQDSSTAVATAVKEKEDKVENHFIPGELKWTSDKAKEENEEPVGSHEVSQAPSKNAEGNDSARSIPFDNQKRWIWAASLVAIFLISFLIGYTILGKQYWREVFDIHTWFHLIKLLVG